MLSLLDQLSGGHPSTLGRALEVAQQVLKDSALLDELFDGIAEDNATIRNRSIRAVQEVSAEQPDWIAPYKDEFLQHIMAMDHWIVRSNVCKILPRLSNFTTSERRQAIRLVQTFLEDESSIVKTCALECLVHLSRVAGFAREHAAICTLVQDSARRGETAALRARARKMMRLLKLKP